MSVFYASYGSNLFSQRFLIYINGGEYRNRVYSGCKDKTIPVSSGWMFVPYRLYFAKQSLTWDNGGVAFLSPEKEDDEKYHTLVRLWLITESQFNDIWEQEGKDWYNTKLYLGKKDNKKIYTFTGNWLDEINPPAESYIDVIKKGLKETTNWDNRTIEEYLKKFL